MQYLAGTMDYQIHYSRYPTILGGYGDVRWISEMDELYVMSGHVFTLASDAFKWRSCKQTILTRSTVEIELMTLDRTTVEANWLLELLMDLPIVEKPLSTIPLNCDNQTMIIKIDGS
jgi:hypothetical protein